MTGSTAEHDPVKRRWLHAGFVVALVLFAAGAWGVHRQNQAAAAATADVERTLQLLRQAL